LPEPPPELPAVRRAVPHKPPAGPPADATEPLVDRAEPRIDPACADRAGRWLLGELERGNWRAARGVLDRTPDPDDRHFYVSLCANRPGRPDWLDAWAAAEPDAGTPLLVRGAQAITWAWEARGSGRVEETPPAAFRVFWKRLEMAEADLREAAARNPRDPTPPAFLVTSCRGLELGLEELADRFKEVVARHPWHRGAHSQMVQGLSDKWGGSHALMLNFAREAAAGSPGGGGVAAVVAEAHIECYLAIEDRKQRERYFEAAEVLGELHRAADWSVRHPAWHARPGWQREHNLFAFCFAMGDDHRAALAHFEAVDGMVTVDPWRSAHSDPVRAFSALRDRSARLVGD
jgi:hypothetical protein